jgi:hypothetical protein
MQEKYAKLSKNGPNPVKDAAGCFAEAEIEEAMFRAAVG